MRRFTFASVLVVAFVLGCSSNGSSPAPGDAGSGGEGGPAPSEDAGTSSEDAGPPGDASAPTCTNDPSCPEVGVSCGTDNDIVSCQLGPGGCLVAKVTACASSETCESTGSVATCACNGSSQCTSTETTCLVTGILLTCTVDSFGCIVATETDCALTGLTCPLNGSRCECADTCSTAGKSCASATSLYICNENDAGCFTQIGPIDCSPNEVCAGSAPSAACVAAPDGGADAGSETDAADDGG